MGKQLLPCRLHLSGGGVMGIGAGVSVAGVLSAKSRCLTNTLYLPLPVGLMYFGW